MKYLALPVLAAALAAPAAGQERPSEAAGGVPAGLPDYSYAGYGFGTADIPPAPPTSIAVADHGAVPDDGLDDTKAVQRALEAARKVPGPVTLRFPSGRTQITEMLRIDRSDIVLEGTGSDAGGSELWFPRPLELVDTSPQWDELREYLVKEDKRQIEPENNIDYLFSEWSWSGGFLFTGPPDTRPVSYDGSKDVRDPVLTDGVAGRQFERTLTVADPGKLRTGQVIQLQWFATRGKDSAIIKSLYGDTELPIGSHHWTFPNRPTVSQSTRIVAISGKTVTLGDPLLHDVRPDQPAVVANWEHLTNVGIQNLAIRFPEGAAYGHHLEQGFNGIYMTGVFDGWVRNVVIDNADSGILTDNAASLTIADVTTTGDRLAHYAVHVGAVHNVLVRDLRVENPVVHPLTVNTRSTRSVFTHAQVLQGAILDQHSGSNHQNLFDDVTLRIAPKWTGGAWTWRLWEGGGAPYWKPGHGIGNTTWNARLVFDGGPAKGETLKVMSGLEGPGGTVVGISASGRPVEVDYRPTARILDSGRIPAIPSLYEYQLNRRTNRAD
ncbi:Pectate lyase superfamily protein [Tsuneonella dongtanensis]|uniref:Pectate lyase superfamily protein n=1 Tax=Tsuneonella dongtanensis TaxID=692370 RepID=A0A1B2ADV7_9SPHN|nr:hypothetical protein [Tsuneonella dongtanensis]ANY20225.1 Pectate lyase superfamily protein [Tsuneonella dongtanensis]